MKLTDLTQTLAVARSVFPGCIIGGGAARDCYHNRPIKDIDLMVAVDPDRFTSLAAILASVMGGTVASDPKMEYTAIQQGEIEFSDYTPDDIDFDHVRGLTRGHPINLINRGQGADLFSDIFDYDFGLSQIAVTTGGYVMTPAFWKDVEAKTITYTHADAVQPDWHVKSSAKRLGRLLAKYPGFEPACHAKLLATGEVAA